MAQPTYLFHAESSSTHYWLRRPTTGTPPGPLPVSDASSTLDAYAQFYGTDYDSKRALIIGAHNGTASIRVISPDTMALVAEYFIGTASAGNARHVGYDPVGDRYYLAQRTGSTDSGSDVTVWSCKPDGTDAQSFPYLSDMVWNTASTCLAARNDGQTGIAIMSVSNVGGSVTSTIHRMNPDGTRASTVDLPTLSGGGTYACDTTGRNMALLSDGRTAVLMHEWHTHSDPADISPTVLGLLTGDLWETVDDAPNGIIHTTSSTVGGVTTYFGTVTACLAADPNGGVWVADNLNRPEVVGGSLVNHYWIYRWTQVDGWADRVGEWPAGDFGFVAALRAIDVASISWSVGRVS